MNLKNKSRFFKNKKNNQLQNKHSPSWVAAPRWSLWSLETNMKENYH